jgi:hypothetical protein
VSRWLSLHTGVFFGLDRRTDNRRYRIHQPRVGISGGIQPQVLRRVLTEDFFERGLPARFLFAAPPSLKAQWNETGISDELGKTTRELFDELWLLQPDHDQGGEQCPKLLSLDAAAKAAYVRYYNECGTAADVAGEREEAAWSKLSGYAARLALVGQLARDPHAEVVTGEVVQAACDLARWFGNEAMRIYASLAEPQEQRDRRRLVEFIECRGRVVTIRDVMQGYWPLKNQRDKTEAELSGLAAAGYGQWQPVEAPARGGWPTRKFHLYPTSTLHSPSTSVDVDAPKYQKNEGSREPDVEAVSKEVAAMPKGILEL